MEHKSNQQPQTIDATDKAIGRIASQIAVLLRGKNKPEYQPHLDGGGGVAVINIAKAKFSGVKLKQAEYKRHSGYPGGLVRTKVSEVFAKNPGAVLRRAVWSMLPKNKLRRGMIKRLKIV
ncbi:50S ribosomal protein L13 [Candidatus Falkowbacteria bacterium RIFCSPLOWO2_12_FULL_45_10]|uniref:Large ribosomal subunit protein uL13 n=4 Tax=Candidatus Falkowiibacteriota TaxID=1752728 RepID=A0A1F5RXE3_9BACT|nr:MAG: 50S ribosomal protein L13 [Candidatus Falkowbacteria bacterium RIFCSPLOWO2_12_FULL_45_10]OGF19068.1 MAG: 50S ribosomal protein L13 [Candidatus Falkowbacteria bacterium RIFCSPHIGHO2_02_FULL_45_15]OGF19252.1 MAG: 50S ribosomal protein L13 [Candidatus Falkowbacteria bacterium RIFCSPLOWO2_02_FULL_45_15]PIR92271.1 MAG: 50S ribosomal protein L13 [Candidatus Falkowbacteria bacterium CG10_big_fil_rev_8_21_14_0_10_44_15]